MAKGVGRWSFVVRGCLDSNCSSANEQMTNDAYLVPANTAA